MDKNKLNISNIEAYLDSLLGNKVSANVFFDTLPPVIKDSWKDLLLVDCSYLIRDLSAYGLLNSRQLCVLQVSISRC